jgi:hypothetical protein
MYQAALYQLILTGIPIANVNNHWDGEYCARPRCGAHLGVRQVLRAL